MPDGEFEYVKPPHFYIDKEAEEDTIPAPKIKSDKIVSTSNPLMDGNMNNNEDQNEINETLHTFDDSPAFDPEAVSDDEAEGSEETGQTAEIEISIDDDSTSTQKIVVKETEKPSRGRTPKLLGQEEEIAAKYSDGMTLKELSDQYGVSVPCVSGAIKRTGTEIRSRGRQKKS
tara:strand:+ start:435 stop:953 length:519 start_codon:yes stop_codon:yes gene_type:complete